MHDAMKTRNFCKVAKDFGISLCGSKSAKKWSIYGHDNDGFFYCDQFPKNYLGTSPTLKISRYENYQWVTRDEKSRTSEIIWTCYLKNGSQKPIDYSQLDCAKNRRIKEAKKRKKMEKDMHTEWRLQYGKHGSYCDGFPTHFANFNNENTKIIDEVVYKTRVLILGTNKCITIISNKKHVKDEVFDYVTKNGKKIAVRVLSMNEVAKREELEV